MRGRNQGGDNRPYGKVLIYVFDHFSAFFRSHEKYFTHHFLLTRRFSRRAINNKITIDNVRQHTTLMSKFTISGLQRQQGDPKNT